MDKRTDGQTALNNPREFDVNIFFRITPNGKSEDELYSQIILRNFQPLSAYADDALYGTLVEEKRGEVAKDLNVSPEDVQVITGDEYRIVCGDETDCDFDSEDWL